MSWYCAECHAPEDSLNRVDAVCHHCGKPLCRRDQVLILDEAFASASGDSDRVAVHCRSCRRQFHPMAFIELGQAPEANKLPRADSRPHRRGRLAG